MNFLQNSLKFIDRKFAIRRKITCKTSPESPCGEHIRTPRNNTYAHLSPQADKITGHFDQLRQTGLIPLWPFRRLVSTRPTQPTGGTIAPKSRKCTGVVHPRTHRSSPAPLPAGPHLSHPAPETGPGTVRFADLFQHVPLLM